MAYTTQTSQVTFLTRGIYHREEENVFSGAMQVVSDSSGNYGYGWNSATNLRTSNKSYKSQILLRQDVSAPYSVFRGSCRSAWGVFSGTYQFGTKQLGVSGHFVDQPFSSMVIGDEDLDVRDLALLRLKRKLQEQEATWRALPFLGESRELFHLVEQTNRAVFGLFKELISVKRKFRRRAAKWAADAWLYHSFTINPLLSDVKGAAEALARSLSQPSLPGRVTAHAEKKWKDSINIYKGFGVNAGLRGTASLQKRLDYRYTVGFDARVRAANSYKVENQFGFSLGQLPATAWELTAFSWVADYFATVGPWLEDMFTDDGGSTRYCTLTKVFECFGSGEMRPEWKYPYSVSNEGNFQTNLRLFSMNRTVLGQLPRVALRWKTTAETASNGLNRLLNLASILVKK